MEITIDTKRDSPEDIKKAIQFLRSLIQEGEASQAQEEPMAFAAMFSETTKEAAKKPDIVELKKEGEEDRDSVIPQLDTY